MTAHYNIVTCSKYFRHITTQSQQMHTLFQTKFFYQCFKLSSTFSIPNKTKMIIFRKILHRLNKGRLVFLITKSGYISNNLLPYSFYILIRNSISIPIIVNTIIYRTYIIAILTNVFTMIYLCLITNTYHFFILTKHPFVKPCIPLPIASAIGSVMLCGDKHHRA